MKYHINPKTGRPNLCNPEKTGICKYAEAGENPPHYDNKADAKAAYEITGKAEFGATTTLTKEKDSSTSESTEETAEPESTLSKYSFVRQFKEQEERFEEEFDGVPTRFFNADLRKKNILIDPKVELEEADMLREVWADPRKLVNGMFQALTSPTDANISDDEMIATGERLGLNLEKITDARYLRALGVQEAWVHVEEHESGSGSPSAYVISSDKKIGQGMAIYSMRFNPEDGLPRKFKVLEARSLVGADRMQRKTGENLLQTYMHVRSSNWRTGLGHEQREATIDGLLKLEEAQLEGRSFKAQQKFVKESSAKIATVWDSKKDTDDVRKAMAENSKIKGKGKFRSIDLDNDVDPEAFAKFESDFLKIQEHLPKFPEGMEPELRIRKLGKHGSNNFHVHGLFNPTKNSIAIDIRDGGSSSSVHEIFHQWDIVSKGNLSLTPEFRELSKEYSKLVKIPPSVGSKADYYHIPTEQLARMAEVAIFSKTGDDNMLLDSSKFDNFDYEPMMKNPEFKAKIIDFFDRHMK